MEPGETLRVGDLEVRRCTRPATPRACSRSSSTGNVFTGDTLFKNSVGGVRAPGHTTYADLKRSIMDMLLALPPETVDPPRPHRPDDGRPTSGSTNAFVRVWRGLDPEGAEPCTALGEPATLVLLGDDYDGGHKAWVRWPDGSRRHRAGLAGPARLAGRRERRSCLAMARRETKTIPTSRVRRTATVGRLAAGQAVRQAGTRAANVTRADEEAAEGARRAASSRPPSRSSPRWGR